jgi:hypothetical protein
MYAYMCTYASRFPCRWSGNSIVILDQCRLDAPYTSESLVRLEGCNETGFKRIASMVSILLYISLPVVNSTLTSVAYMYVVYLVC